MSERYSLGHLRTRLLTKQNNILGTSVLQIPTTQNLHLRPFLPVLAITVLPFAAPHGTVSASAKSIHLLLIYGKFHVIDGKERSLFFGVKRMPTSFPKFLLLSSYFCPPCFISL